MNIQRKLASIQIIQDLQPIPNADNILVATINGWKVVVGKADNYKVGDWVVYCEIDSFLPIRSDLEFLRKSSYRKLVDGTEGYRLKTVRLRGQISQGLILPYSILGDFGFTVSEGSDVTDMLGITKWEDNVPVELTGTAKGNFPSWIPRTDEERVQNLTVDYPGWVADPTMQWYETEKLDGSSVTYYWNAGVEGVCSRNYDLIEDYNNQMWSMAAKMKLFEKLGHLGRNLALQGEIFGEGLQGNPYKIVGQQVRFFNIWDIDKQEYLGFQEFLDVLQILHSIVPIEVYPIKPVPVLSIDFKLPATLVELLQHADGPTAFNTSGAKREGVVIRSHDRKISFKVISNSFLLDEK